MITAEISTFTLYTAFLMRFARRTEIRFIAPMRPEGNEPHRLLTLRAPQNPFHRRLQVVVAHAPKHTAKPGKRQLVRLQERLLGCMQIGAMKPGAATHAAHAEHVHLL